MSIFFTLVSILFAGYIFFYTIKAFVIISSPILDFLLGDHDKQGSDHDKKISIEFKTNKRKLTYIDDKGYLRFTDSNKLYHRWIMEKYLRRRLYRNEVVHHRDRNKLNNTASNLQVMSEEEHHEIHREYLTRIGVLQNTHY